jgi:Late embryogenesis abundant protein
MSKDCGHHHDSWSCFSWSCSCKIKKKYRKILIALGIFIILVLLTVLIVWLTLRPTKPHYSLQDLIVYNLNLTGSTFLSTTLQATLKSHNPNDRIGIYYDKLDVYAVYKGQQITIPTGLPTQYQGHDDISVYSPYMYGTDVPLAPYLTMALNQDQAAGYVLIGVRVHGRLRWKVGTWISGNYHIDVNCPAFLTVGGGGAEGHGYHFNPVADCNVDV